MAPHSGHWSFARPACVSWAGERFTAVPEKEHFSGFAIAVSVGPTGSREGASHLRDGSFSSAEAPLLSRLLLQWQESLSRLARPVSSLRQHSSQASSITVLVYLLCNAVLVHLQPPASPCYHTAPPAARTPGVAPGSKWTAHQRALPRRRAPASPSRRRHSQCCAHRNRATAAAAPHRPLAAPAATGLAARLERPAGLAHAETGSEGNGS